MRKFGHVAVAAVAAAVLLLPLVSADQDSTGLSLSWGAVRTEAEKSAVRLAIEFADSVTDIFDANMDRLKRSGDLTDLSPSVKILTGEEDCFNGIVAKISGHRMYFKLKPNNFPDTTKMMHAIPIAVGLESNRHFDNLNVLAEVGYVPFLLGESREYKLGVNPAVGAFLQAGYKFELHDTALAVDSAGGAADESGEEPDSGLLRLKAEATAQFELARFSSNENDPRGFYLLPRAAFWYDIANSETYYRLEAIWRTTLTKNRHFDLNYEKGSGPPNFNRGDQFSANLTVNF